MGRNRPTGPRRIPEGAEQVSRSVTTDYESLRERQARAQEAERIGPVQERCDQYEREDHQ